jgi:hypothetical protein
MGDDRIKQAIGGATGIGPVPSRSSVWSILEAITGIPLDPDWYRNASREEIFMNTMPQAMMAGAGARLAKMLPKPPKPAPQRGKRIRDEHEMWEYPDKEPLQRGEFDVSEVGDFPIELADILTRPAYTEPKLRVLRGELSNPFYNMSEAQRFLTSEKPLSRREFFGRTGEVKDAMRRDNANSTLQESYNEGARYWKEMNSVDGHMSGASLQAWANRLDDAERRRRELNSLAGELFDSLEQPSLISRWRAVVNAPDQVEQAILNVPKNAGADRRVFFRHLRNTIMGDQK